MSLLNKILLFYFILPSTISLLPTPYSQLYSQSPNPLRIEIDASSGSENFNLVLLKEKGLVLFYESIAQNPKAKIRNPKFKSWIISKYDTLFSKVWNKEIDIPRNFEYINYYYDNTVEKLYILLLKSGTFSLSDNLNSKEGDLNIISVDLVNGGNRVINSSVPQRVSVKDFKVINDIAYISGNTSPSLGAIYFHAFMSLTFIPAITGVSLFKYKPVLISVNLNSCAVKSISGHYKGNAYMLNEQVIYNYEKPYLITIVKNIARRKETALYLEKHDAEGKLSESVKINLSPDTSIVSASYVKVGNDIFFTGTYKKVHRRRIKFSPFANAASELSLPADGLVFSKFINDKPEFIKYYSFKNLQILNSSNVQNKKVKYKKKKVNTDYQVLLHDIIKNGNEYILSAEAYYPEYHLEYYWFTDPYGRMYQNSREVFDGYRYTHAIIVAFNSDGKLLWDNIFEIGNILSFNLSERVRIMFDKDDIVLAYSNEGKISSKVIYKNQVIQSKEETPIDRIPVNDKLKINYSSDMDYWYNNYFITYGFKKVSDKDDSKTSKSVFFFNKIAFQ